MLSIPMRPCIPFSKVVASLDRGIQRIQNAYPLRETPRRARGGTSPPGMNWNPRSNASSTGSAQAKSVSAISNAKRANRINCLRADLPWNCFRSISTCRVLWTIRNSTQSGAGKKMSCASFYEADWSSQQMSPFFSEPEARAPGQPSEAVYARRSIRADEYRLCRCRWNVRVR